ncbi:MAG: glutamate formimidoyltransferase [Oligoflexia bacterium]|nr:glutamate formimidoyltransferase [Oligoflexia bacterium]
MNDNIIECVPNISEGRDREVIDAVVEAVTKAGKARVLDVFTGYDTNRSVITIMGDSASIGDAAFACIKTAAELIDMGRHRGVHPRMGATDVCPFIPVANAGMEECIAVARKTAKRAGEELGVPVYLYGKAALLKDREDLAFIRRGEYEGLEGKLKTMKPDFGPAVFNERVAGTGATAIGARDFLIAFNVNLSTCDVNTAKKIAANVRESGCGPDSLKCVKGIGWYIEEYSCAQLSFNVTDFNVTPLHVLFGACVKQAVSFGISVTGSELVGMIPKKALVDAGLYFCEKKLSERELIEAAVKKLGLDSMKPFNIDEKVIEFRSMNV